MNVIDFGMNVQDAVNWPRIHHQWLPDELRMERGFSPDTVALLKARGHTAEDRDARSARSRPFSREDGWLEGAADPRTEATAEGY